MYIVHDFFSSSFILTFEDASEDSVGCEGLTERESFEELEVGYGEKRCVASSSLSPPGLGGFPAGTDEGSPSFPSKMAICADTLKLLEIKKKKKKRKKEGIL